MLEICLWELAIMMPIIFFFVHKKRNYRWMCIIDTVIGILGAVLLLFTDRILDCTLAKEVIVIGGCLSVCFIISAAGAFRLGLCPKCRRPFCVRHNGVNLVKTGTVFYKQVGDKQIAHQKKVYEDASTCIYCYFKRSKFIRRVERA